MTASDAAAPKTRTPRMRTGGPTIADVARQAGVSPMTVSRVINADSNVLAAKREKVQQAIATLDYVPNPAARNLAGGRQCRIALLYANPSAAYLSEFLMGSLAQASLIDAQLVVEQCDLTQHPRDMVRRLAGHRVNAVLLPPPLCDDAGLLRALNAADLPMAQIATGHPVSFAHAVTIGDQEAAQAMTAHLISLGHRHIGFIAGAPNQTASACRHKGYKLALRKAGITSRPEFVAHGDFTYRSGLDAAEILIGRLPRPTAIFASNDDMAAAVVAVAHRYRLEVPGDLSVCGFDDTAMSTSIWPEITTIHQPVSEMARQATAILAASVRNPAKFGQQGVQHIRLGFRLLHRASDGPPKTS